MMGHTFDITTQRCTCGVGKADIADARKPRTHADVMNPGTVAATYHQRSTGRVIEYRKPV